MRKTLAAGVAGLVFFLGFGVPAAVADDTPTDDSTPTAATTLKLARTTYSHNYKAASVAVKVTTNAESWSATDDADWVSVTPASGASGDKATIAITDNLGAERTATVTVTAGDTTATVKVTQKAAPETLVLAPTGVWQAPYDGAEQTVTATTNADGGWTAATKTDWLTVAGASGASGDSFKVTAAANDGKARLGSVTVTAGAQKKTYWVKQEAGPILKLSRATWTASEDGASVAVKVTSPHVNWTATVSDGATWLHVEPATGADGAKFTLTADENPTKNATRTATVTVTNGHNTDTLQVTQRHVVSFLSILSQLLQQLFGSLGLLFS
jgi:hypothetical protein